MVSAWEAVTLKGSATPAPKAQAASPGGLLASCEGAQALGCQVWAWGVVGWGWQIPTQSRGFLCHGHFPYQSLSFLICARGAAPQLQPLPGGWKGQRSTFSVSQTSVIPGHCRGLFHLSPTSSVRALKESVFSLKKELYVITENKCHLPEIESNHKDKHSRNNVIKPWLGAVSSRRPERSALLCTEREPSGVGRRPGILAPR